MNYCERFTEVCDVLAAISPQTANGVVGAHATGYVSLAEYHRAFALLHLGEPGQGATIDVAVTQATDTLGTGAKAVAGKAPNQAVAADAGGYIGIELRTDELDASNDFNCVQVTVTVGAAAYTYSLYVFGLVPRYEPVGITDFHQLVP